MMSTPHPFGSGQSLPGHSFQQTCHKFAKTSAMVSVLIAGLGREENGRLKGIIAQKQT